MAVCIVHLLEVVDIRHDKYGFYLILTAGTHILHQISHHIPPVIQPRKPVPVGHIVKLLHIIAKLPVLAVQVVPLLFLYQMRTDSGLKLLFHKRLLDIITCPHRKAFYHILVAGPGCKKNNDGIFMV